MVSSPSSCPDSQWLTETWKCMLFLVTATGRQATTNGCFIWKNGEINTGAHTVLLVFSEQSVWIKITPIWGHQASSIHFAAWHTHHSSLHPTSSHYARSAGGPVIPFSSQLLVQVEMNAQSCMNSFGQWNCFGNASTVWSALLKHFSLNIGS